MSTERINDKHKMLSEGMNERMAREGRKRVQTILRVV